MSEQLDEMRPGSASEEESPEEESPEVLPKNLRVAHYDGAEPEEAARVWMSETLCVGCLSAGVCRVADGAEGPLVVVSRCLAYIPSGG